LGVDGVFRGKYRGRQVHVSDFDEILKRASSIQMSLLLLTSGNIQVKISVKDDRLCECA